MINVGIPMCPEAISNREGESKQDCELKAAERWVTKFRKEHPKLPEDKKEGAVGVVQNEI